MKFKIAQLAAPLLSTPPKGYGGTERVVSMLTEELVRRGHQVTLYATRDSRTRADLKFLYRKAVGINNYKPIIMLTQAARAFDDADDFDVIHNHEAEYGITLSRFVRTPVLTTLHNDYLNPRRRKMEFGFFKDSCYYAFISRNQHSRLRGLKYGGVVYNATDTARYRLKEEKKDYFLFLGNVYRHKGPHIAIRVAKRLGTKIYITGKYDKGKQEKWFEKYIRPQIDGKRIIFHGILSFRKKLELYQNAKALLFPIQWEEPFGLVMIEAMACGTPVVAYNRGSVPEIVKHGETGFIANTYDEFLKYSKRVDEIEPKACRRWVEKKFSIRAMTDGYEKVYKKIIKG